IIFVEGGRDALKAWLQERAMAQKAGTGAELAELARLQLISGDAAAARATVAHAERILPLSTADMFDGSQLRFEYSAALIRAGMTSLPVGTNRGFTPRQTSKQEPGSQSHDEVERQRGVVHRTGTRDYPLARQEMFARQVPQHHAERHHHDRVDRPAKIRAAVR